MELRVIEYQPPGRMLFALHDRGEPLLVGLDLDAAGTATELSLVVSAVVSGSRVGQLWQAWRLRCLGRRAAAAIGRMAVHDAVKTRGAPQ
jgi:hypothetical protein